MSFKCNFILDQSLFKPVLFIIIMGLFYALNGAHTWNKGALLESEVNVRPSVNRAAVRSCNNPILNLNVKLSYSVVKYFQLLSCLKQKVPVRICTTLLLEF